MSGIKLRQLSICSIPVIGKCMSQECKTYNNHHSVNVIDIVQQLNNLILALNSP